MLMLIGVNLVVHKSLKKMHELLAYIEYKIVSILTGATLHVVKNIYLVISCLYLQYNNEALILNEYENSS